MALTPILTQNQKVLNKILKADDYQKCKNS